MAEIYILSDYGKLSKKDETIVFSQPDGTSTILFPFKTEHLVLVGKVSISADALRLLTKYKIGTTFLSSNGRFNGKLSFGDGKNIFLRQKQFRILDNPQKSLEIAKSIVTGKIRNEISFMQRIKRKNSIESAAVENAINAVKNTLSNAEKSDDIDNLRGYEGLAARKYFEVFKFNLFYSAESILSAFFLHENTLRFLNSIFRMTGRNSKPAVKIRRAQMLMPFLAFCTRF